MFHVIFISLPYRYIYCDSVDLTLDLVLPTLYLAKKYILPALADRCVQYLEENLAPENVCLIYEQSLFYDEKQLVDKCTAFIETRSEDIIMASGFLDVAHETLLNILKFDKLTVAELDLFKACLAWAEQECRRKGVEVCPENNRLMLNDTLYHVRFPTMELSDFANVVAKTRILTAEEKCAVFEYMTVDDCDHLDDIVKTLKFPTTYRQRPLPSVLKRFTAFGKSNVYSGDCSIMKLQCDKPVLLKGFGIHGSTSYDALAELTVTIKQDKKTLLTSSINISDDRSGDCMHIMLPDNVVLRSSVWYTVIVTFHFYGDHDQGSCKRGRGGYRCITSDGVSFDFDRADSAGFLSEVLFCRV